VQYPQTSWLRLHLGTPEGARFVVTRKSTAWNLSAWLRAMATACALALIGLAPTGPATRVTVGTNSFELIAIAISNINFGLHGGLGYIQIYQKLHSYFSASSDPFAFDDNNDLRRPQFIDRAIKAAAAMTSDEVKGGSAARGDYVVVYNNDIGHAYFYMIAFRLFGFSAFATHYLYLLILTFSFLLFAAMWWRSNVAMALGALTIGAIFLASNSAAVWGSNKFLSTLALIPMLHLLMTILDRSALTRSQVLSSVVQALFMILAIWGRSSASWTPIAVFAAAVAAILRYRPDPLSAVGRWLRDAWRERIVRLEIDKRSTVFKPAFIAGLVIVMLAGSATVQAALLDRVYFGDGATSYHLRWHSIWLGLAEHPDWPLFKPFDDQPDVIDDDIADVYWSHVAVIDELPYTTAINSGFIPGGTEPVRLTEDVERSGVLAFAAAHPLYMLELEAWYKPKILVATVITVIGSIPIKAYLLFAPVLILGFLLFRTAADVVDRRGLYVALVLMWLCSLLPSLVTYPEIYSMVDNFSTCVMFACVLVVAADRKAVMSLRPPRRRTTLLLGAAVATIFVIWGAARLLYDYRTVIRIADASEVSTCKESEIVVPGTIVRLAPESARDFAALACNGKIGACAVPASFASDRRAPSPECVNEFRVKYRCGASGQIREAVAEGEADKRRVLLSCNRPS
jgi:hypothetical protein